MTHNMMLAELQTKLDRCQNTTLAADYQWSDVSRQLSYRTLVLGRITMSVYDMIEDRPSLTGAAARSQAVARTAGRTAAHSAGLRVVGAYMHTLEPGLQCGPGRCPGRESGEAETFLSIDTQILMF